MSQEWNPGQLLEISGYYWKTCALHAGVKLDVFTAIGHDHLTGQEIAQKLHVSERGITMLLNALTAMNFLAKTNEKYANTPSSFSLLSKDSPQYIGFMIMHHSNLVPSWSQLDQGVKAGEPVRTRASLDNEEHRENFLMGMFNMAMSIAPELAKQVDLSSRHHLLDLGGGPGTYAIHFCLHNAHLKGTVYDLPTTRPFAEKTIARFGIKDRVDFQAGNYLEDPVKGKYDVAWLSHILHAEGPENCQIIINKAAASLEPGGIMMIHDFILNNSMDSPLFPALFSLNMLLGTQHGQSYSEQQIMDMLHRAGLKEIRRTSFRGPTDSGIIIGVSSPP